MKRVVDVAAAVIVRDDGAFLLGRRPPGGVYAGYWEFPGGKVEPGETPREALSRELREELGIEVGLVHPWIVREFIYEHAHVRLHFFRVLGWSGSLRDLQHDALAWQFSGRVEVTPLLPANAPVLAALALPNFYAISHAATIGVEAQIAALERALESGTRLIQLRETALPLASRMNFIHAAVRRCHQFAARVLVNGDVALAMDSGADGVHLTAAQMMALSQRPGFGLVGASCHDQRELAHAAKLGLDFVVVGPVAETTSHPGRQGLGWNAVGQLLKGYPLPAYALGGLSRHDMPQAWNAGAQGIAAIRGAWQ